MNDHQGPQEQYVRVNLKTRERKQLGLFSEGEVKTINEANERDGSPWRWMKATYTINPSKPIRIA